LKRSLQKKKKEHQHSEFVGKKGDSEPNKKTESIEK